MLDLRGTFKKHFPRLYKAMSVNNSSCRSFISSGREHRTIGVLRVLRQAALKV